MKTLNWGNGLVPGRFDLLRWLAIGCLLAGSAGYALAKTYTDNGDGTATDPTTGLTWMRCSVGQTWTGNTCSSTASTSTWAQANALTGTVSFAGQSDWRLPSIRELQTIVDRPSDGSVIDTVIFPNTTMSDFWTSTSFAGSPGLAWYVHFSYGSAYPSGDKSIANQVRLVRAGSTSGVLNIARPSTDYVDQGDGTVIHSPTSLMWQRCAVGQTWTGSTCSGTATDFIWGDAKLLTSTFAGQTDWRLPTEEELLSLSDYSRFVPAINTTLFPNGPGSGFWSTSAYAQILNAGWYVDFSVGVTDVGTAPGTYKARLVRTGPALAGPNDGIYQWSAGNYLSLHQDGTHMIATIYFNADGSFSFPATSGGGVLPVPQLDLFDLMNGQVSGSTVRMSGTRFHRTCNVVYDFTFNTNATITVTRISVGNAAAATTAGISCSAIVGAEASTLTVPKIRFNQ